MLARLKVWLGITSPSKVALAEAQAEIEQFYLELEAQYPDVRFR